MPWTGAEFKSRHNQKLTIEAAEKAARMANAMLKRGVSEAEAIRTANKHGDQVMRHTARRKSAK